ncbi:peptide ABC transporter permease [Knoellia sp. Soil729]|nr:peptide ABC transporter permease [Knoellia sp. Soil729]
MPRGRRFWNKMRASRRVWGFVAILLVFLCFALVPALFSTAEPLRADLPGRLLRPGTTSAGVTHWLGTDQLGRDVWSRIVYGSRASLTIAFAAVFCAGIIGSTLGVAAGTLRGWVGAVIMRIADMVLSVPFFLLAILTVVVLGPSLVNVVLCLALVRWPRYTRVAYGQTLEAQGREFVRSAVAVGSPPLWVIRKHIIPEVIPAIIVVATLELGLMVLYEASLSFIGLGVQPPAPSWGSMLSDGQQYIGTAWWLATFPGLALFLLVLSVNMLGDFVRDQLDPSERALRS